MSSNTNAVSSAKTSGSGGKVASATGRPSLKNLSRARVPRAALVGVTLATVSALAWKFLVSDPNRNHVTEFYK